jgi:prophage maintenance system killer protein
MTRFRDGLTPELSYLYARAIEEVEDFEKSISGNDLSAREVLRAHFSVADYFLKLGEGIGGVGPKNTGMLISALSRQSVGFGGVQKWITPHDKAATLLFGLVMNHPFHDANKRTAYLSTIHYLFQHGFYVTVNEKALEDMTVLVAERGLAKFPRFRDLKKKSSDPEVEFLSHYFRQNTRRIDKQQYLITYRELDKILRRYDAWMENPHNNTIDIMHWEEVEIPRRGIFGKKKTTKEIRRVCNLGFPGWTRQVGKGRLKHVRGVLGLTPENGVDSQSFFKDVDDMQVLMEMHEGALRRLAYR